MKKPVKMAVISDVHLGHPKNEASYIVKNLRTAFPWNEETAQLDFIFIAGDLLDRLLQRPDEASVHIDLWALEFLGLCKAFGIRLRILEGTPSHDWKQSAIFETLNDGAKIGCDLKYIRELSIVYEPDFDINILYVPDEWEPDPSDTYAQTLELMRAKGLEKIDFAIMHGQFEYQLPSFIKAPKHNSSDYLKIIKYLIFIGHVHVYSTYERIIAQGSFDRLSQGEEGPKGHVRATVFPNGDYLADFVENKNARKFITIECEGLTLEESLREVESQIANIPDNSFIRVSCLKGNPLLENIHELTLRWPLYYWSKIVRDIKEDEVEIEENELSVIDFNPITITRDNITKLMMDRIRARGVSYDILDTTEKVINDLR